MNLPAAALLLPLDISIDPNSNGLPGIGSSEASSAPR